MPSFATVKKGRTYAASAAALVLVVAVAAAPRQAGASGNQAQPRGTIEEVEDALVLDAESAALMSAVRDEAPRWQEAAFYMLLRRVSELPELSPEGFRQLDAVAYRNLLDHPQRYRGRVLRMKVTVFFVLKMTPETHPQEFGFSKWWPRDKSVWRIRCSSAGREHHVSEPMMIFSACEPQGLGKPSGTGVNDEMYFKGGRDVELAAVFYKVFEGTEEGSGKVRKYPLLLAWQMRPLSVPAGSVGPWLGRTVLMAVIVALGALFLLLRSRISRMGRRGPARGYSALRGAAETPAGQGKGRAGQVDPLLKAAAEQYDKERQHTDGTDRQG